VAKQCSIHFAFISAMAVLPLSLCCRCHCRCLLPWPFLFASAGWLLLAAFIHFFLTGTITMIPWAVAIALLAGTVAAGWLLFPKKSWDNIAGWTARAAAMLPSLCLNSDAIALCHVALLALACWHCAMLPRLRWLAGTVAAGWLLFFKHFFTSSAGSAAAMPPP